MYTAAATSPAIAMENVIANLKWNISENENSSKLWFSMKHAENLKINHLLKCLKKSGKWWLRPIKQEYKTLFGNIKYEFAYIQWNKHRQSNSYWRLSWVRQKKKKEIKEEFNKLKPCHFA